MSFKDKYNDIHEREDVIVMAGKFQPFTRGHYKVMEAMFEQNKPIVLMMINDDVQLEDVKSNPLSYDEREAIIEKSVGEEIGGVIEIPDNNLNSIIEACHENDLNATAIFVGSDEMESLEEDADELTENVDIELCEVERFEDDIDGQKVREAVENDDFIGFQNMTINLDESDFNLLRRRI